MTHGEQTQPGSPMNIDDLKSLLAKITVGPWRVGPVNDTRVEDAAGHEVAMIDGDYNQPETWHLMEANARAIALVPDLLAEVIRLRGEAQAMRDLLNTGCDLVSVEADVMKSTISVGGEMSPDEADQPIVELIREAEDWIARVGAMINTTGGSDA